MDQPFAGQSRRTGANGLPGGFEDFRATGGIADELAAYLNDSADCPGVIDAVDGLSGHRNGRIVSPIAVEIGSAHGDVRARWEYRIQMRDQGQAWEATVDPYARVFTTHPMTDAEQSTEWKDDPDPGYWTGEASMPVRQKCS